MSKKKNKSSIWTILIAVLIVGAIGAGVYFGTDSFDVLSNNQIADGNFYVTSNDDFYIPNFGFIKCQERAVDWTIPTTGYETFDNTIITCQEAGSLTQRCVVNFKMPSEEDIDSSYGYLCYGKFEQGQTIPPDSGCQVKVYSKNPFGVEQPEQTISVTLAKDEYIKAIFFEEKLLGINPFEVNKGQYNIDYRPFYIYQYDNTLRSTGNIISTTKDCTLDGDFQKVNPIVEKIFTSDYDYKEVVDNALSEDFSASYMRVPERVVSYVASYNKILVDTNVVDGDKFCVGQKLYPIIQMQTTDGVYYIADSNNINPVAQVDCCNTADALLFKGAGWFCNEDNQFEQKTDETKQSCTFTSQCDLAGGVAGIGVIYYEECINGFCELQEPLEVECTSDYDCDSGSCQYDARNPEDSYCRDDEIIKRCGNGYCEASLGENENTCIADCGEIPPKNDTGTIFAIIAIGAFIIVLLVLWKRSQNKGGDFVRQIGEF